MLKLSEEMIEKISDDIVGLIRQGKLVKTAEGGGLQTKNKRHQYWLGFMSRLIKNEVKLRKLMVKYFKEQEVKALRALGGSKAVNKDVKKVEGVPTSKGELKKLAGLAVPAITEVVALEGKRVLAELGVSISFDLLNPKVVEFIETRTGDLIKSISNTTKEALKATLKQGVELGESIPKLAKRIASVYDDAQGYRSVLIARTETQTAMNNASLNSYRQSKVVEKKTWLTAGDDRVREEHAMMDGETVLLEEAFSNGLMVPSEPACRCTIIAVLFKE
jgi:SPP1 gp7 family putative phage head morphogenesis protein